MPASAVDAALAAGSWVVTPGERLARELVANFDAGQRRRGAVAWGSPRVLSWNAWLDRLWLAALAGHCFERPPVLAGAPMATELWRGVIAEDAPGLLSLRGAARDAARAWHAFHAWRESASERLPDAASAGGASDCEAFRRWSRVYGRRLAAANAIDRAALPDLLAGVAAPAWLRALRGVVLHGFDAPTPQQERLVTAIAGAGVAVVRSAAGGAVAVERERIAFGSPRDELAHALAGARRAIESEPAARVAIVVADLEHRRDAIEAIAEEVLCPEHLERFAPDAPRPYAISLAPSLAAAPIVAAALDLIALGAEHGIDSMRAARLLRSPYLPDAEARGAARAQAEHTWRASHRSRIDFAAANAELRGCDPALAERWGRVARTTAAPRWPRDWAQAWSAWLTALGWPGERPLSSAEWQAREAWTRLLGTFAMLGTATGRLGAAPALARLGELAAEQLFQPQAPIPPIRILGVEESLGLVFDRAWLVGFDDETWPAPARPRPWLPLAWQRARGIPDATFAGTLARARRVTAALAALAPRVVASHASRVDGSERSVSPLFAPWPEGRADGGDELRVQAVRRTRRTEELVDVEAPPVAAGSRMSGGANLIESQSACPFQAFARYRLAIERDAAASEGIGLQERGRLLHAALAAFWTATRDSGALASLADDALAARVAAAAAAGVAQLDPNVRAGLPRLVVAGERERIAAILLAWIDRHERPRPPFAVLACEREVKSVIEGIALRLRIDRIDAFADGGWAIIDYKSGYAKAPRAWFAARPEGTQLATYSIAAAQADPASGDPTVTGGSTGTVPAIRALAFAQVRAGALDVLGMAADRAAWPALDDAPSARGPATSWDDALAELRGGVEALVREIRAGYAAVSPRDKNVCRVCDLKSLCRIRTLEDDGVEAFTDDDER